MTLKAGDTLGYQACPDCGEQVALKLTKNMTVFIYCQNIIDETGERCMHRKFHGRAQSNKIIQQYEKNQKAQETAENEQERHAGDNIHERTEAETRTTTEARADSGAEQPAERGSEPARGGDHTATEQSDDTGWGINIFN